MKQEDKYSKYFNVVFSLKNLHPNDLMVLNFIHNYFKGPMHGVNISPIDCYQYIIWFANKVSGGQSYIERAGGNYLINHVICKRVFNIT